MALVVIAGMAMVDIADKGIVVIAGMEDIADKGMVVITGIDEGNVFAPVLAVGSMSPVGTPPSDGNASPGASIYDESAASCFCFAKDTEEF